MPLLSISSVTTSKNYFERSVSLSASIFKDLKHEAAAECKQSDFILDTKHLASAFLSQKKAFKKWSEPEQDVNNNVAIPSLHPGNEKYVQRSKSLHEFRKVSSNELLPAYFEQLNDLVIIDVRNKISTI